MAIVPSRDWNPFLAMGKGLASLQSRAASQNAAMQQAAEMHKAQYAAHMYGMEMEAHKAGLAQQAAQAQQGRNMEFFGSVLRHAKHETPIHLAIGDVTAQFTKKPKSPSRKPTKTPRPLPVRDPQTGRAMKAPE